VRVLGLIPARGGSKRCPGKNTADLGGKPLLQWTVEAARESGVVDHLVVSSDSVDVLHVADRLGVAQIIRPLALAQDNTPMLPVVRHAIEAVHPADPYLVVLLQPTSPFRTAEDIRSALNVWDLSAGDSVVSVTEVPEDLIFQVRWADRLEPASRNFVVPNGAIYIMRSADIMRGRSWYSDLVYAYRMPKDRSLDIDTPMDLELARMMVHPCLHDKLGGV